MFRLIEKTFIAFITGRVNVSSHTKCVSLNNQQCMSRPTLINLLHNEYNQRRRYYLFAVNLERLNGSCSTINNLSIECLFQTKQKN